MKEAIGKVLLYTLGGFAIIVVIALVVSFPTMWLWNWLMPVIFGLPEITVWQALGLNLLSGILLKSSSASSKK